jgi:AGZA family xanthine/uracil permease-like MFS transporter
VPVQLKLAITVAIGLFIAFIGFVNSGFVTATGSNSPPVGLGIGGSVASIPTLMFVLTLLVTGVLVARKVKGGMLIGLVGAVASVIVEAIWHLGSATDHPGGWGLTIPALTGSPVSIPDLSLLGAVDFGFDIGKVGIVALIMLVFTLVFSNFFDAMGTMTGLAKEAGLADEKATSRIKSALVVEGVGAVVGRDLVIGNRVHRVGLRHRRGRPHGLANVVTGVVFLLAMFFTPLTSIVPTEVAAAALVIVGAMMMAQVKHIDLGDFSVLLPVFLTVSVMPMTYSIANGIGAGFISWVVVRSLSGKARQISPLLWVVAVGFLIYFARGPIQMLLGG